MKLRRTQLLAFHNRPTGTVDPDAANRIHCKSQVARTRQTAAGQNRMAGSMNPDTTFRFHCKSQVAMTLPEIGPDPPRIRRDNLPRTLPAESPGAPHFARSGNNNNTAEGVTGDLTRRWAHGPANFYDDSHHSLDGGFSF